MADITISDLELAPALTDDMVLPVENTTDTYAATLAMLRRLINKTFVEVENADFNALTDDGFYQCTGTPTNSPVAGAINWTLQVSAENGVVVQRAFSLDDNFANLYIRRWNGVTWTGWLEVGAGALANKANISLSKLDATGQAVIDGKIDRAGNYTVIETYHNGTEWYRIWSDGWIEQGGFTTNVSGRLYFQKPFSDTNFMFQITARCQGNTINVFSTCESSTAGSLRTKDYLYISYTGMGTVNVGGNNWYACGY